MLYNAARSMTTQGPGPGSLFVLIHVNGLFNECVKSLV